MRLASVFEAPKGGDAFLEEIAAACDGYSGEVYERAFVRIRDTRKYRSMPMPAECRAVCEDQAQFLTAAATVQTTPAPTKPQDWSQEAAFEYLRRTATAAQAAREGWIGPLVTFVRRQHRMPEAHEVPPLRIEHRKFEDALAASMGRSGALLDLGAAMAKRSAEWAAQILDGREAA